MQVFAMAIVIIAGLGIWCLVRIRREYQRRQDLSAWSVAIVWTLYLFHLGTTVTASVMGKWPLDISQEVGYWTGIPLLIGGAAICAAGIWQFHSLKRMSGQDTTRLVTSGIYRWSRNPQNVGWTLFLVGIALPGRSGLAFALTVLFWMLFIYYVPMEENYLEAVFGENYRAYLQWSHRFLGPPGKFLLR